MGVTKGVSPEDFEGKNWRQARNNFRDQNDDNESTRLFLASRSSGDEVKNECLDLKTISENKYQPVLGGILENIDVLLTMGDLAIKSAPESVGLAWMGVRVCLRAIQGDWATFQLFSGACADIVGIMISCRVYGKMYGGNEGPQGFQELHDKVVEYIPKIYTDILTFSYGVFKYTRRRSVIRIGQQIFRDVKGNFEGQIDGIKAADVKMRDFAKTASERLMIHLQKESLKGQSVMSSEIASLKGTLDSTLKSNEAIVRQLLDQFEEERKDTRKKTPYEKAQDEYEDIMRLLDPHPLQHDILKHNLDVLREPGTCRWIFELEEYISWHDTPRSSILWVSGEGGYGKSILMSTIVEQLQTQHPDESKTIVDYFFCKAGLSETQDTEQIFKTISAHLYERCLPFPEALERANEAINKGLGRTDEKAPVKFDLEVAFGGLVRGLERDVFLVIDGLDECLDREKQQLLKKIRKVVENIDSCTKIMICSRPKPDIAIGLSGVPNIKCEDNNKHDIEKNVTNLMRGFPGWTTAEKSYAIQQIVEKSCGQFKFVQVAMEFLRKPLVRPFEPYIQKLPSGLVGSYITSWNATDPDYRELLKAALTWVLFGDETVTVPVIMDAYSRTFKAGAVVSGFEREDDHVARDVGGMNLHERQITIAGGQFLEVTMGGHLALRHLTVRDFFVTKVEGSRTRNDQADLDSSETQQHSRVHNLHDSRIPWSISEHRGHLAILRSIFESLTSEAFQEKYLLPHARTRTFRKVGWREPTTYETDGDDEDYCLLPEEEERAVEPQTIVPVKTVGVRDTLKSSAEHLQDAHNAAQDKGIEQFAGVDKEGAVGQAEIRRRRPRDAFGQFLAEEEATATSTVEATTTSTSANLPYLHNPDDSEFKDEVIDYGTTTGLRNRYHLYDPRAGVLRLVESTQYRYEITHWVYHLRHAQAVSSAQEQLEDPEWKALWDQMLLFITKQRKAFKSWLRLWVYHDEVIEYLSVCRAGPLHIASILGLHSFARFLIAQGHSATDLSVQLRKFGAPARKVVRGHYAPLDFAVCPDTIDADTVKVLVDSGANINCTERTIPGLYSARVTPLLRIITNQPTKELIEFLLTRGADSSVTDFGDQTVLHYFSQRGSDPDAMHLLLKSQPDTNLINSVSKSDQLTPLHVLVNRKDNLPLDLLSAYLQAGADPNLDDKASMRPLRKLALHGNAPAVKILIDYGADVDDLDNENQTALHVAAQHGNTEVLQILCQKGAKLNLSDKNGRTPLLLACRAQKNEAATYLIRQLETDPENEINKADADGDTPLREAATGDSVSLIKLLLTTAGTKESINAVDNEYQQTALHRAVVKGSKAVLQALIEAGGALTRKDKHGHTPFQLCIRAWMEEPDESVRLEEKLAYLILQKAPPVSDTADLIFTAASKGSIRVFQALLDAGIDPSVEDAHGWTPAMVAQQHNQQAIVDLLAKQRGKRGQVPSGWVDMAQGIAISSNRLIVRPAGPKFYAKTIITDHPIPVTTSKFYFEIEIAYDWNSPRNVRSHERLVIGYTTYPTILTAASLSSDLSAEESTYPFKKSYAWDVVRNMFHEFGRGFPQGPRWVEREEGDVIGCGVDFEKKRVFFTNNGKWVDTNGFDGVSGRLFPAVSLEGRYIAKANFGKEAFVWEEWRAWSMGL